MFTADDIKSFQKLYRNRFGIDISDSDAQSQATALVLIMKNIYKPMTEKEYQELQK